MLSNISSITTEIKGFKVLTHAQNASTIGFGDWHSNVKSAKIKNSITEAKNEYRN